MLSDTNNNLSLSVAKTRAFSVYITWRRYDSKRLHCRPQHSCLVLGQFQKLLTPCTIVGSIFFRMSNIICFLLACELYLLKMCACVCLFLKMPSRHVFDSIYENALLRIWFVWYGFSTTKFNYLVKILNMAFTSSKYFSFHECNWFTQDVFCFTLKFSLKFCALEASKFCGNCVQDHYWLLNYLWFYKSWS